MTDLSRSIPSATKLLAESVQAYRRGFPGIARAFLPVYAIFAVGQVGLTVWGTPDSFGGLVARALSLAAIGLLELLAQAVATAGVAASVDELPTASLKKIYRNGAKVFWPALWSTALVAVALSAVPAAALILSPYVVRTAAVVAGLVFGDAFNVALLSAVGALASLAIVAVLATLVLVAKLAFTFSLVTAGRVRGVAALEASAGLSDGRGWAVGARLATGIASVFLAILPFVLVLVATESSTSTGLATGSPWAWSLFAGGYLLVAVPFGVIFLARLAASLRDTEAEREVVRKPRPWVRWVVRVGVASWALGLINGLLS